MDINEVEPITIAPINELNNDSGFEPQARLRANTWPVRPREFATPGEETNSSTPPISDTSENALEYANVSKDSSTNSTVGKKGGTRRNAWGSLSYADLITKAIESSTEKRLTLSQIYDWMVQNVPYFKDKGDNNSSAGWKNSIRHNLSLHNRFMRVQNEGTGKSSWWVLNPDAKPGKTPRRRAASMDPKEMAKKRGRAKKRVEQLRTGDFENYRQNSNPGSEFSSTSDLSSISGDPFALSPHDIRARTGSNASSFGRLSPIQAGVEPEIDDGFGSSWGECLSNGKEYVVPDRHITSGAESVSEHLAELFMGDSLSMPEKTQPSNIVGNHTSMNCSIGMMEQSGFLPNPPAYSSHPIGLQQHRGTYGTVRNDGLGAISSVSMLPPMPSRELYKNSEPFVSSPGYPKTTMSGMSLRDLLSDSSSDVTQHHGQDFTVDVKFLQECAIPPNRNLPSPKEITRTPPSNAFMPSIRISPQHQQPMMVGGITNAIMQQQQQQQQCSPNSPPQQQQYNAQIYRNLQQRMSSENLLQAVQMKGMQAQMLRCSPTIKQEPLSFPASPIVAKSEPVSPVSCMPASPTNRVSGCRLSANDLTRHYSYIKQENQLVGGNYGTSDSFSTYPPPLPMDLDFSLQELRAGGLECDVDSILQEGNFDLDFHSGMSGISGDMPFS